MRLTVKDKEVDLWFADDKFKQIAYNKLGQLEDLMEKYDFKSIEMLDNFIASCLKRILSQPEDKESDEFGFAYDNNGE